MSLRHAMVLAALATACTPPGVVPSDAPTDATDDSDGTTDATDDTDTDSEWECRFTEHIPTAPNAEPGWWCNETEFGAPSDWGLVDWITPEGEWLDSKNREDIGAEDGYPDGHSVSMGLPTIYSDGFLREFQAFYVPPSGRTDGYQTDIYDFEALLEPGNVAGVWRIRLDDGSNVVCTETPLPVDYAEFIGWQVQLECTWEQPEGDGWGEGWVAVLRPAYPA